jgi:demethylmenaquinone methyltransferase/2-methoxy-6-polyprenyl-1,4-benzoquinol methylase
VGFGIRNVSDPAAAFRDVRRVLRPGGRFVVLEFSTPPPGLLRRAYHLYFHHVLPHVGRAVSGHPDAYAYLPESVGRFPGPEGVARALGAAGFEHVAWSRLSGGIAALHVARV